MRCDRAKSTIGSRARRPKRRTTPPSQWRAPDRPAPTTATTRCRAATARSTGNENSPPEPKNTTESMAQVDIALSFGEALRMADLVTRLRIPELLHSALHAVLYLLPFLVVVYVCERRAGADRARYWTRHFLNDSLYTLFY